MQGGLSRTPRCLLDPHPGLCHRTLPPVLRHLPSGDPRGTPKVPLHAAFPTVREESRARPARPPVQDSQKLTETPRRLGPGRPVGVRTLRLRSVRLQDKDSLFPRAARTPTFRSPARALVPCACSPIQGPPTPRHRLDLSSPTPGSPLAHSREKAPRGGQPASGTQTLLSSPTALGSPCRRLSKDAHSPAAEGGASPPPGPGSVLGVGELGCHVSVSPRGSQDHRS